MHIHILYHWLFVNNNNSTFTKHLLTSMPFTYKLQHPSDINILRTILLTQRYICIFWKSLRESIEEAFVFFYTQSKIHKTCICFFWGKLQYRKVSRFCISIRTSVVTNTVSRNLPENKVNLTLCDLYRANEGRHANVAAGGKKKRNKSCNKHAKSSRVSINIASKWEK